MKILGEKSLSSKVIIGLNILFAIISLLDLLVLSLILKVTKNTTTLENKIFEFIFFTLIILTGIIALYIIHQFIKIFKNLKSNILFSKDNSNRLNKTSNSCFIISTIYLVISVYTFLNKNLSIKEIIYYILIFSITLMTIFVIFGIGIKILNEIYKKAIEYKEENDFTI